MSHLVRNPVSTRNNSLDVVLNLIKSHRSANLALKVVYQTGQAHELFSTGPLRAVVVLLAMHRAVEVAVECLQSPKFPLAEETLIGIPIPCLIRSFDGLVVALCSRVLDHLLREDTLLITASDGVVDRLTIDLGTAAVPC